MKRYIFVAAGAAFALASAAFTTTTAHAAAPVSGGLQLWLDATDASTVRDDDNDQAGSVNFDGTVQTWQDKSGNANHATASNVGQLPGYTSGAYNNQPTLTFNPTNTSSAVNNTTQSFNLTNNIVTAQETMFFALRMFDNGDNRGTWVSSTNSIFLNDNNRYFISVANQNGIIQPAPAPQTFSVVTETRDPASTTYGEATVYDDGGNVGTYTGTLSNPMTLSMTLNRVGRTTVVDRYYYGDMSEVLIYTGTLNTAQRVITENYLSSKYGTTLTANDKYAGDTSGNGHYDFDVFGIGSDVASTLSPAGKHSSSAGGGISLVELNTSLDAGDYLLAGNDRTANGYTTADVPAGVLQRWNRIFYLDATGTLDASITFDFASDPALGAPGDVSRHPLLYRSGLSGTFSIVGYGTVLGNTVSFDLLGFDGSDDGYYTIAVPEPTTAGLVLGTIGWIIAARRRRA